MPAMAPTTAPPKKVRRSAVPEYLPLWSFISRSPKALFGPVSVYAIERRSVNIYTLYNSRAAKSSKQQRFATAAPVFEVDDVHFSKIGPFSWIDTGGLGIRF